MQILLVLGTLGDRGIDAGVCIVSILRHRGCIVQPILVGPAREDAAVLSEASGRRTANLDTWLYQSDDAPAVFYNACEGADCAVVVGGMRHERASPALREIVHMLGAAVVLVSPRGALGDAAHAVAMLSRHCDALGAAHVGVLCCGAPASAYSALQARLDKASGAIEALGYIPQVVLELEHDVCSAGRAPGAALVEAVERHVRVDRILALAAAAAPKWPRPALPLLLRRPLAVVRVAVADDVAFSPYFYDNLLMMEALGCEIVPVSLVRDAQLPGGLAALYISGDVPPDHVLELLSINTRMRASVAAFANAGGVVYAESGGLVYLSCSIRLGCTVLDMAGVLPLHILTRGDVQARGYVQLRTTPESALLPPGLSVRGFVNHSIEVVNARPIAGLGAADAFAHAPPLHFSYSARLLPSGSTLVQDAGKACSCAPGSSACAPLSDGTQAGAFLRCQNSEQCHESTGGGPASLEALTDCSSQVTAPLSNDFVDDPRTAPEPEAAASVTPPECSQAGDCEAGSVASAECPPSRPASPSPASEPVLEGFSRLNVLASMVHAVFASCPAVVSALVDRCRAVDVLAAERAAADAVEASPRLYLNAGGGARRLQCLSSPNLSSGRVAPAQWVELSFARHASAHRLSGVFSDTGGFGSRPSHLLPRASSFQRLPDAGNCSVAHSFPTHCVPQTPRSAAIAVSQEWVPWRRQTEASTAAARDGDGPQGCPPFGRLGGAAAEAVGPIPRHPAVAVGAQLPDSPLSAPRRASLAQSDGPPQSRSLSEPGSLDDACDPAIHVNQELPNCGAAWRERGPASQPSASGATVSPPRRRCDALLAHSATAPLTPEASLYTRRLQRLSALDAAGDLAANPHSYGAAFNAPRRDAGREDAPHWPPPPPPLPGSPRKSATCSHLQLSASVPTWLAHVPQHSAPFADGALPAAAVPSLKQSLSGSCLRGAWTQPSNRTSSASASTPLIALPHHHAHLSAAQQPLSSLSPAITDVLTALGVADRLVGATSHCDLAALTPRDEVGAPACLLSLAPDATEVRWHGGAKGAVLNSAAVGLMTGLLLSWAPQARPAAWGELPLHAVGAQARRLVGPDCQVVELRVPNTLCDALSVVEAVGVAAGLEIRASALVSDLRRRLRGVARACRAGRGVGKGGEWRARPPAQPKVMVLTSVAPYLRAGGWLAEIVELAGGQLLDAQPGDAEERVDWDDVLALAPEVLVLAPQVASAEDAIRQTEALAHEPGWWTLPAVRSGAVYIVKASVLARPGPGVVTAAQLLGHLLSPENVPCPPGLSPDSCHKLDLERNQRCRPSALPGFFRELTTPYHPLLARDERKGEGLGLSAVSDERWRHIVLP